MNIEAFLLCDAATDSFGKLNVLGAFDALNAPSFPVLHPQCAVVARLRLQRIESGKHKITVHFVDDDGKFLIPPLDGEFQVSVTEPQRSASVNIVVNIQSLKIEHPGEYAVVLAVDGREVSRLPLHVQKLG